MAVDHLASLVLDFIVNLEDGQWLVQLGDGSIRNEKHKHRVVDEMHNQLVGDEKHPPQPLSQGGVPSKELCGRWAWWKGQTLLVKQMFH